LREDFCPDSDIDVLVEFQPGKTPGFFTVAEMEAELSVLFGNRKVDLRTPQDLSRYFRDRVLNEDVLLCRYGVGDSQCVIATSRCSITESAG